MLGMRRIKRRKTKSFPTFPNGNVPEHSQDRTQTKKRNENEEIKRENMLDKRIIVGRNTKMNQGENGNENIPKTLKTYSQHSQK